MHDWRVKPSVLRLTQSQSQLTGPLLLKWLRLTLEHILNERIQCILLFVCNCHSKIEKQGNF